MADFSDLLQPNSLAYQNEHPPEFRRFDPSYFNPELYAPSDGNEASAYEPTWRDRIASALIGDQRPSMLKSRMVEELTGSSGVGGHVHRSADDVAPYVAGAISGGAPTLLATLATMGTAAIPADLFAAQEAHQAGDDPTAVGYGLGAAAPFVAPAYRAAKTGIANAMSNAGDYTRMIRNLIGG